MSEEYWIPISFNNEETEIKLEWAITACHEVHLYTIDTLNSYFLFHAENYLYSAFRRELNLFLKGDLPFPAKFNLLEKAQRYSLVRAAEKSFPYFNENKKFKKEKFIPVKPLTIEQYNEIQIPTRQVWHKYMVLNDLITTVYGTINLEEGWANIIDDQAEAKGIPFNTFPFMAHSITILWSERETKLKFNLHDAHTKFGKKAKQETKKFGLVLTPTGENQE